VPAPLATVVFLGRILEGRFFAAAFNAADIRVFMFLAGSTLYLWRDRVPMGRGLLFAALACLALASIDESAFFVAYVLLLAPLVLHLAYIPKGRIRAFNDWGDFSYGVYIYAFPIQQTLAFLFPRLGLVGLVALAALITVSVAALSWVLIEKRALARKEAFAAATERALGRGLVRIAALRQGPIPSSAEDG
jgi:peptidoglycan/LPS O-acetylase OafA/YrhL